MKINDLFDQKSSISEAVLKKTNDQIEKKEKKLWFKHYFAAREQAKKIFNVHADIEMLSTHPKTVDWDINFDLGEDFKKLIRYLEIVSVVPTLLIDNEDVKKIANVSKMLSKQLPVYANIRFISSDEFTMEVRYPFDPDQERSNQSLLRARKPKVYTSGIYPLPKNQPRQKKRNWRMMKRNLHNKISIFLKDFLYPENLIELARQSKMLIKI